MNQAISYKLKYLQTLANNEGKDGDFIDLNINKQNSWMEIDQKLQRNNSKISNQNNDLPTGEGLIRSNTQGQTGTYADLSVTVPKYGGFEIRFRTGFSRGTSELGFDDRAAEETTSAFKLHLPSTYDVAVPQAKHLGNSTLSQSHQRTRSADLSVRADSDDSSSNDGKANRKDSNDVKSSSGIDYESLLSQPYSSLKARTDDLKHVQSLTLMKALVTIFEGRKVTGMELEFLSDTDLLVLSALFSKKCKISFRATDTRDRIAEFINQHLTYYKHKRNEENYKLVFKKAIKHLSKKLKTSLDTKPKDKYEMAYHFYLKYFREPFRSKGLDKTYGIVEEKETQPRKGDNNNNKLLSDKILKTFTSLIYNPKTVNPKYISMVACSKLFIDDVIDYLNTRFIREYSKSRYFKLERILMTCFASVSQNPKNFDTIKVNIENNPRFKMPWYDDELVKAVKGVQNYLVTKCGVQASAFMKAGYH